MHIRPYTEADQSELLHLLRLNTPQYFAPEEEADYVLYLQEHLEAYYVVEIAGQIAGAGGLNYFDNSTWARISWDLVHPDFQGQGIGRALTQHRIREVSEKGTVRLLQVRTTQLVYRFYQKLGFALEKVEKDFWADGFDLYQMQLELGENAQKNNNRK